MRLFTFATIILILFFNIACSIDESAVLPTGIYERNYLLGVVPLPANFPGIQEDWENMFVLIDQCADLVTAQNPWRDSLNQSGEIL